MVQCMYMYIHVCINLCEGSPVHVGTSHIEMFLVHYPEFGVQNARALQSAEVETADLCNACVGQGLGLLVGKGGAGGVLDNSDTNPL